MCQYISPCVLYVCMSICVISSQSTSKNHVIHAKPSCNFDALLNKTHSKVLVVHSLFYKDNFTRTKALILAKDLRTSYEQSQACCSTEHKNKVSRTRHKNKLRWKSITEFLDFHVFPILIYLWEWVEENIHILWDHWCL